MVFGHNSNIKLGANTLHVQTEDRGGTNCMIDTTVYYLGRVLHRRTNNYHDLLPLTEDNQQALKLRVDEQHRTVLEAIRSGELQCCARPFPSSWCQLGKATRRCRATGEIDLGTSERALLVGGETGHASRRSQRGRWSEHIWRKRERGD